MAPPKTLADPVLLGQIVRYGISGVALTLFYSAVYWGAATQAGIAPLIANTLAFLLTVAIGYPVHSRWSFAGHGQRGGAGPVKFLVVNIAAFALNSFWVWLIVERMAQSVELSLVPIVFVTPVLQFLANRYWAFG